LGNSTVQNPGFEDSHQLDLFAQSSENSEIATNIVSKTLKDFSSVFTSTFEKELTPEEISNAADIINELKKISTPQYNMKLKNMLGYLHSTILEIIDKQETSKSHELVRENIYLLLSKSENLKSTSMKLIMDLKMKQLTTKEKENLKNRLISIYELFQDEDNISYILKSYLRIIDTNVSELLSTHKTSTSKDEDPSLFKDIEPAKEPVEKDKRSIGIERIAFLKKKPDKSKEEEMELYALRVYYEKTPERPNLKVAEKKRRRKYRAKTHYNWMSKYDNY